MALLSLLAPGLIAAGALTAIERLARRQPGDWWRNLQAWALDIAIALAVLPLLQLAQFPTLLGPQALPFWAAFLLFLVLRDLGEFLFHVAQHKVPWLWAMHSLHHSDPEMSALTTNRHFWGDQLIKQLSIWPATAMIIVPSGEVFALYAAVNLYHYLVHSNLRIDFGRWSWVLNSPAYHRRHHSALPEHYDTNFAALFPIFDVMIGTYRRPDGWPPSGLESAPQSLADVVLWPLRWRTAGIAQAEPHAAPQPDAAVRA